MDDRGPDDRRQDEDVLAPKELDVADDDSVRPLDENRFVVSLDDDAGGHGGTTAAPRRDAAGTDPAVGPGDDRRSRADSRPGGETPAGRLADAPEQYGLAAAAKTERGLAEFDATSNNVAEVFEAFLRWYAGRVADDGTPPAEVVEVLLAESDLDA